MYKGTVSAIDITEGYYKVLYTDDDEEELSETEVRSILVPIQENHTQTTQTQDNNDESTNDDHVNDLGGAQINQNHTPTEHQPDQGTSNDRYNGRKRGCEHAYHNNRSRKKQRNEDATQRKLQRKRQAEANQEEARQEQRKTRKKITRRH